MGYFPSISRWTENVQLDKERKKSRLAMKIENAEVPADDF